MSPFLGDRLLPLLYVVCRLPTLEEETAVLKESDRLVIGASPSSLPVLKLANHAASIFPRDYFENFRLFVICA